MSNRTSPRRQQTGRGHARPLQRAELAYVPADAGAGRTWQVRPGSIAEGMAAYARQHAESVLCEAHSGVHAELQSCSYPHYVAPAGRQPQVGHPYRVTD